MFSHSLENGLELKILELRHAPFVYEAVVRNREYLRRWLPWVDKTHSADDVEAFIKMSLEQFAANEGFAAGIFRGPECIGTVGFHRIDWANKKVELGYWLEQPIPCRPWASWSSTRGLAFSTLLKAQLGWWLHTCTPTPCMGVAASG